MSSKNRLRSKSLLGATCVFTLLGLGCSNDAPANNDTGVGDAGLRDTSVADIGTADTGALDTSVRDAAIDAVADAAQDGGTRFLLTSSWGNQIFGSRVEVDVDYNYQTYERNCCPPMEVPGIAGAINPAAFTNLFVAARGCAQETVLREGGADGASYGSIEVFAPDGTRTYVQLVTMPDDPTDVTHRKVVRCVDADLRHDLIDAVNEWTDRDIQYLD